MNTFIRNITSKAQSLFTNIKNRFQPEDDPNVVMLEDIRNELIRVREDIKRLEFMFEHATDEYHEYLSHELQAKREYEHLLIRQAKKLYGVHIHIPVSLREHREIQKHVLEV